MLGHVETKRKHVTVVGIDECGNRESYPAVAVTYRPVYANGAKGKPFVRTYRTEPSLICPPTLAKNVLHSK